MIRGKLLNVGGGPTRTIPQVYVGCDQKLLDIDPEVHPDVCMDARDLGKLDKKFSVIYCSHTLEHFHHHDVPSILSGFMHILEDDGFAHIEVPDLEYTVRHMLENGKDIMDVFYYAGTIAIKYHDVLFGWQKMIKHQGVDFYAHKTGFSKKSLSGVLRSAGFRKVLVATDYVGNLKAFAFKKNPGKKLLRELGCL